MVHFFDSRHKSLRCLGQDRRRSELHRAHHLYGNVAGCASLKVCRSHLLGGSHDPNSVFALDTDGAASTVDADSDAGASRLGVDRATSTRRFNFAVISFN